MIRQNFINRGQRLSPSARKIIKLRNRAFQSGGASLELQVPTNYIREVSRDLNYDITSDASLIMTPNTIGESRLFNCKPDALINKIRYSEEFENAAWVRVNNPTITSNATLSPFGDMTADLITPTAINSYIYQNYNLGPGTYTFSVYIKAQTGTVTAQLSATGNGFSPTLGTIPFTVDSTNWTRVILTITSAVAYSASVFTIGAGNTLSTGENIYVWGAQLELGSIATTYQRTTDGIIDFQATRATTATVVQKDGSIGDSCYNIFQRSEEFNNSFWQKDFSTATTNAGIAPNGTNTANKLTEDVSNNQHNVRSTSFTTTITGLDFTLSIYAKSAERTKIAIRLSDVTVGTCQATFDLVNGVFSVPVATSGSWSNPRSTSENMGNGWYRISITATKTSGTGVLSLFFIEQTTAYVGSVGSGIYIWGAQLVQGSTPKDYFKTTNRLNVPSVDYTLGSSLPSLLVEPQRTNIVFPSATATTQSRTVTAQPYTLSFYGTGTVTLSGVFSGSLVGTGANNLVSLTFTPTAGSLTFTITGSVANWQCEAGAFLTSRIVTTTATATRNAYTSFVDMFNNSILNKDNFTLFVEGYIDFRHSLNPWLGFSDSPTLFTGNSLYLYNGNAVGYYVGGARTDIALTTSDQVYFKTVIKKSGTSLKVFTDGVLKATDTLSVFDYRYLIISDGSARNFVQKLSLWKRTLSDADCILLTS